MLSADRQCNLGERESHFLKIMWFDFKINNSCRGCFVVVCIFLGNSSCRKVLSELKTMQLGENSPYDQKTILIKNVLIINKTYANFGNLGKAFQWFVVLKLNMTRNRFYKDCSYENTPAQVSFSRKFKYDEMLLKMRLQKVVYWFVFIKKTN